MKKLVKMILVAIPALGFAAAVGMTTIGCGDDTTTTPVVDMAMMMQPMPDLAMKAMPDLQKPHD
jgi:hypothetical protein